MQPEGGQRPTTFLIWQVQTVDPDMLVCWDTNASLNWLIERADTLGVTPPLLRQLGKSPPSCARPARVLG